MRGLSLKGRRLHMDVKKARTALAVVAALFTSLLVANALGAETPPAVIALGSIIGITYGLLAVGLVLVYRSNRIINFAHGEVGAFAAAVFGILAVKYGLNYYLVLPVALIVGAGTGAASEVLVVRRLRNAPKLMSIVATLGVGQFLVLFGLLINAQAGKGSDYPEPPGLPSGHIGKLVLTPAYTGMLVIGPLTVLALASFLKYSKYGLAIRFAAANPEAARMAGIPAARMSALTWALAGGLSAMTAILTQPTRGFSSGETFGPGLLLRALTAAVLARMNSLPVALVGGLGLGVVEQLIAWNTDRAGVVEVALFGLILVTLLLQRQRGGREEDKGSWAAVQALRPVPEALQKVWAVRNLGALTGLVALGVAALLPVWVSNSGCVKLLAIVGFTIVGLSVGIVTGLAGQLSLGQYAIAAIGAWASYQVSHRVGHFEIAFLYAGLAGAITSLVIGLPALRVRGLFLTATTLSFALATPAFLLQQDWVFGSGIFPGAPIIGKHPLDSGKSYYLFSLVILAATTVLARNVRRGGFGRVLIAVRDNEEAAKAFTVRASVVKIQAFLFAGFLAGVGGAVYAHGLAQVSPATFPVSASIGAVAMSVIGGISLLAGPLLGALFVVGIPAFLPLDSAGLVATSLGQLLVIMYVPGGLGGLLEPARDAVVKGLGRRAGLDVEAIYSEVATAVGSSGSRLSVRDRRFPVTPPERLRPDGSVMLHVQNLRKSFGGVRAVRGVEFDVRAGETLGLIGPNGAGKTTTFELLGGFTRPDEGRVIFNGQDVTALGPDARARLGLVRSFQDAALFPTLTVKETVRLALERDYPSSFTASVLGLPAGARQKDALTDDLLHFFGLGKYGSSQIRELSTGTRRITEMACMVALRPTVLLLDEPSSGVAQRETEALGQLLEELKRELRLTLVIIEHDIPMIMKLSDRIVAMADGEVIASGRPEDVRNDPAVVEAYLGGSLTAIERSGTQPARSTDAEPDRDRPLTLPGVGRARATALLAEFGSIDRLREATVEELERVPGVGRSTARRVHEALQ